jgi:phage terminase small subunit
MANRLTVKQRKFAKEYVANGGNATQAALKVYDTTEYHTAGLIGHENINKPKLKQAIETALIRLDITPEDVLKSFKDVRDFNKEINPNASVRANENLANIMNLYPSQKSLSLSDGSIKSLSWQE